MDLINPEIVLGQMDSVVERKNYLNKIKIIKLLYTQGSNTANNIGQIIGISLPTVSLLLGDLLEEKLIMKQGRGESQGGESLIFMGWRKAPSISWPWIWTNSPPG